MKLKLPRVVATAAVSGLILSLSMAPSIGAQVNGITLDFAGAQPLTYSHLTGGGAWNTGIVNTDIARSLEGENFACRDVISYLTKISVGNTGDLRNNGAMTAQLTYAFDLDTTGQSGVSLNVPVTASINTSSDTASSNDGGSTVSVVSQATTGPEFTSGSQMMAVFNVTDIEANETIVLRINAKLGCKPGSSPTGNLQAKLMSASLIFKNGNVAVNPAQTIGSGTMTIDLKSIDKLVKPTVVLEKTVTKENLACPGSKNIVVNPGESVKYCYKVTNPSNSGSSPGATLFNVSEIIDDNGPFPGFNVPVANGLADLDSDGFVDDLAPGQIARAEKVVKLDSEVDLNVVNIAVVTGADSNDNLFTFTATDTAAVLVDAPEPAPAITIQKNPEVQTVLEGAMATFNFTVTNTGNVPLTNVSVVDAATPACNNTWATLTAGQIVTYSCTTPALTANLTNVAVVSGNYLTTPLNATDTATVTVDLLPKFTVTKTPSVTSVPETGGAVTFSVVVKNLALEVLSLTSLIDDIFGNLNGVGTCVTPTSIGVAGEYSCAFTKTLAPFNLTPHLNTVTATGNDPEQHQATASDNAAVTFTDVLPDITLTKSVNPTAAKYSGDYVDYHFVIGNQSLEPVNVFSFVDNQIALSPACSALIGTTIAPNSTVDCWIYHSYISGTAGGTFTNTATVVGKDNEGNADTATASAVVNFWWYGRTPGYWKNHPEQWVSGYLPANYVQSVFTVPSAYLTGGILDLNMNGVKDSLIDGLAYRGGSTLSGGAQILLRAAIAALLNEAYYGADYPGTTSTSALITSVNNALATMDRAKLIKLANYFDYWNNAVHANLP